MKRKICTDVWLKTDGLPEGVIAEFEGVLTTNKEDRDLDVLEPSGALVDPRMPLLWQHDANHPIGKFIGITDHTEDKLSGRFALADTPLGQDALKLAKLDVLRLSIGFKPIKYKARKNGDGWHVQEFEVLEASLVSVPSNTESVVTALQTEKFCSPVTKGFIQGLVRKQEKSRMDEPNPDSGLDEKLSAMETRLAEAVKTTVAEAVKASRQSDKPDDPGKAYPGQKEPGPTSKEVFKDVKVKKPSERYDDTWRSAKHYRTGQPVFHEGREAAYPSQRVYAKAGAFLKYLANKTGVSCPLSAHERDLLEETFAEDLWCGSVSGQDLVDIPGVRAKALLDDSTSGGAEVVPEWFDAAIITFPLLQGELYPFVDHTDVPRGRNVEGASMDNPTVTWGTADGTTQDAFDTADLIAEINSTIYPVSVNVEIGRDFMADAAVDVGRKLVENIGNRFAAELDYVIAVGNGTSQPQGLTNASGVTDVGNPEDGAGAAPTVTDYETLYFGVAKQYRKAGWNFSYIANDTSYQRARAVPVSASDDRRVFGMETNTHADYALLGVPYKIQGDIPNATQFAGCLKKYRMYRRQGQRVQWTSEGKTLAQANLALVVVRGRYGGRVMDANAFCKQTNAQA